MVAYTNYLTDARVRREAETLASTREYKVTILLPRNSAKNRMSPDGGVVIKELRACQYQGHSRAKYVVSYLKFMIEAFRVCNRMFREGNIWGFHVHNIPNFLVFSVLFPRLLGGKVILDIHDSVPETYAAKFNKRSRGLLFQLLCLEESLSCRLANKLICVNHPQKDTLAKRGIDPEKITISMNVPDPKIFPLREEPNPQRGDREKAFRLVYHGTLARRLGIDLAIRAVARLKKDIPGIEFYIFGDGNERRDLEEVAKNLGVDQNIHFPGLVPLEDITSILKDMDLGIISNRRNVATDLMLPVKMLEYVALEIPVVAPRLRTIEYYFDDRMINFFEPENVASMANAILQLYQDALRKREQVKIAKEFLDRYGWEKHQSGLLELYRNLHK